MKGRWRWVCLLGALVCGCGGDDGSGGFGQGSPTPGGTTGGDGDGSVTIDAGPPPTNPGALECQGALPQCEAPAQPGLSATICGVFVDIETSEPVKDGNDGSELCTEPTAAGPCSVELRAYDALEVLAEPESAEPIAVGAIATDECGRFAITDMAVPFNGFVALRTIGPGLVPTLRSLPVEVGARMTNVTAPTTRTDTDDRWTRQAGDPFEGQSLAERGVAVVQVVDTSLVPRAGVRIDSAEPVYYFSDQSTESRSVIAVEQAATGANGTALTTQLPRRTHTPPGGSEPCRSDPLVANRAGYVFFGQSRLLSDDLCEPAARPRQLEGRDSRDGTPRSVTEL